MVLRHVSIVIPAHNAARHLTDTLLSVDQAAQAGTEVILVDDGSTDHTASLFSQASTSWPRAKLVTQSWAGLGSARNAGLAMSSGEFIAFLDSDDHLYAEGLERLVRAAEESSAPIARGREARHAFGSRPQPAQGTGRMRWMDSRRALLAGFGGTLRYLYRRDFLLERRIAYPTHLTFAEDLPFAAEVAAQVRQFPDLDVSLYSYQVGRPGQLTSADRTETWPKLVDSLLECERRVRPYSTRIRSSVGALEWWYALRGLPQASGAAADQARASLREVASGAWERLGVRRSAVALDFCRIVALQTEDRVRASLLRNA